MIRNFLYAGILSILFLSSAYSAESDYSKPWCASIGGRYNVPVKVDGVVTAYVDCLTESHAFEVDFASKFYESVGQSHYYAAITGKQPGIALIRLSVADDKYVKRLNETAKYFGWHCLKIITLP